MGKGVTINCSVVEQDGEYEVGFNYSDSDGLDIEANLDGDDVEEVLDELVNIIVDEYTDFLAEKTKQAEEEKESDEEAEDTYVRQLEKIIEDLTAENNSLKTDNDILQRRADDAVNNSLKEDDDVEDIDVEQLIKGFDSLLKNYRKNPYVNKFLKFYY